VSDDLIKRIRRTQADCPDSLAAADMIEHQAARIATLEQTLREIANADTVEWDDPTEFEAWAKSRARWTLAKGDKE
jgi:hypothetical protein